jgi:hypothetical protein
MTTEIPGSVPDHSPEDLVRLQHELDLMAAELLLLPGDERLAGGEDRFDALLVATLTEFEDARRGLAAGVEEVTPGQETTAVLRAYLLEVETNLQVAVELVGRERVDHHLTEWLTDRASPHLVRAEVAAELSRVTLALRHLADTSAVVG